jgi:hypothetical protein
LEGALLQKQGRIFWKVVLSLLGIMNHGKQLRVNRQVLLDDPLDICHRGRENAIAVEMLNLILRRYEGLPGSCCVPSFRVPSEACGLLLHQVGDRCAGVE